jgi:hypothetical protein
MSVVRSKTVLMDFRPEVRRQGDRDARMAAPDEPGERECLLCYLGRMLSQYGCDNTKKWTVRWRDRRFPGHDQVLTELEDRGGCCCDCEVIMNVWEQGGVAWEEEAERRPPLPCGGIASHDPLDLCARWSGWYLRPPGDPYGDDDDDDDDFEFRCGF